MRVRTVALVVLHFQLSLFAMNTPSLERMSVGFLCSETVRLESQMNGDLSGAETDDDSSPIPEVSKILSKKILGKRKRANEPAGDVRQGASSQEETVVRVEVGTKSRPYRCSVCKRCFKRKNYLLSEHAAVHTGKKSFKCPECDNEYIYSSGLLKHIHAIHKGKRFVCSKKGCEATFTSKGNLDQHKRIVHEGRRFVCSESGCSATFTRKKYLQDHMNIHTGQRPYECPKEGCGARFIWYSSLGEHQRTVHTDDKPYSCKKCGNSYKSSSALCKHLKVHHRKKS